MDRNTITGLVLIFLVMIAWGYFSLPSQQELQQQKAKARRDSIAAAQAQIDSEQTAKDTLAAVAPDTSSSQQTSIAQTKTAQGKLHPKGMFGKASQPDTSTVTIQTPLYKTTFTNVGAGPASFMLKDYKMWDQKPLQLIRDTTRSAYTLGFLTSENYNVDTDNLVFKQITPAHAIDLQEGDSTQIQYALNVAPDKRILYTYTLHGDSYKIDLKVNFEGLERTIIGSSVDFGWKSRLNLTEKDASKEARFTSAYAYTGGELEQLNLSDAGHKEKTYNGSVSWVATRTSFFTQIIKSENPTQGALLKGQISKVKDKVSADHHYESYITSRIPKNGSLRYKLYVGPKEYHALDRFDPTTYQMVNVGYSWTRWFSGPLVKYIIIPYFDFVGKYMNMGFAIILFGILVKMILFPLTQKSYKSMAAMKELQPELQEIKEKYKDDPKKQQSETMKLYKKAKVNPIGGCLPNLLQLPILITLYRFFEHSILIRQEAFLWAKDLSTPDYIIHLPFSVPFLGAHIAGFVLLMTVAMFFQTKVSGGMGGPGGGAGGGQMAAMKYIFPFMMLFIFNNFAAGLSLYYLVYNVVSIGQQLLINKQIEQKSQGVPQVA